MSVWRAIWFLILETICHLPGAIAEAKAVDYKNTLPVTHITIHLLNPPLQLLL